MAGLLSGRVLVPGGQGRGAPVQCGAQGRRGQCLRVRAQLPQGPFGDNVEGVLAAAGMSLANLVRLTVHTKDVDLLVRHYGALAGRLGAAGAAPATTMLGVTRLAIPGQLVELEGTAVA
ncbi:Rid family hydrolase [Streptomyces sp. NPDC047972]|uniref:Rid family hydrolase n=1 Tax=Streptomyces sp. NPDC047972 TaxID=3365493 RepID=UPI0037245AF3